MFTFNPRLMAGAALSAALLAGCGGSNDDHGANNGAGGPAPGPALQTVTDVVAYINSLIAGGSDSAEPVDINPLTLAADDGAEPAPLP